MVPGLSLQVLAVCLLHIIRVVSCHEPLEDVKQFISQLESRDVANLSALSAILVDQSATSLTGLVTNPTSLVSKSALEKSVAILIQLKSGKFQKNVTGSNNYEKKFNDLIGNTCENLTNKLNNILGSFYTVIHSDELMKQLNKDQVKWLLVSRICIDIMYDKGNIRENSFQKTFELAPPRKASEFFPW